MSALTLYRTLTTVLGPVVMLYLIRRLAAGREDRGRFAERRGVASRTRPDGPLVWVHAASVGEAVSMLALIDELVAERLSLSVLVTTGTVTSARLLATRLPENQTKARGVPLVLVNARMSADSFQGWQRWPSIIRPLLGAFDLCLGQDVVQTERLRQLGAPRALCVGNLKTAAGPLPVSEAELVRLAAQTAGRPLWLAASTHAGEEDTAAAAHRALKRRWPDILTIIVPRHPVRAGAIAAMLKGEGFSVARRSLAEPIEAATEIYLGDTLGELGLFYRLAGVAFIGGSLVPMGGHNPLEAALLDCALLHGPDMSNCAAIARDLAAAGAALTVRDDAELAAAVAQLIGDPVERARRAACRICLRLNSGPAPASSQISCNRSPGPMPPRVPRATPGRILGARRCRSSASAIWWPEAPVRRRSRSRWRGDCRRAAMRCIC